MSYLWIIFDDIFDVVMEEEVRILEDLMEIVMKGFILLVENCKILSYQFNYSDNNKWRSYICII